MESMGWERWARAGGIGFAVFTVASFIVGGEPPKISDSADEVVSYYTDDRGQVSFLPSCLPWGLCSCCGSRPRSRTRFAREAKAAWRPRSWQPRRRGFPFSSC